MKAMAIAQLLESQAPAQSRYTQRNPNNVRFLSADTKEHELSLVPYVKLGDGWTLGDGVLEEFANLCRDSGTFQTTFYEGHIKGAPDFIRVMQQPTNVPVFVFRGREPIGFAWLNGIAGNRAFAHFCMVKKNQGQVSFSACRMILDYWMSWQNAGEPVLDVIIGVIPAVNKRANRFIEGLGFVRLGEIPGMLKHAYTGNKEAAVISYYLR
jgi:RimJ/RimL family protein N-acetyltransferase